MKEEFNKLVEENKKLRNKFALIVKSLSSDDQEDIFFLLNEIINNEIEQEKYCNQ